MKKKITFINHFESNVNGISFLVASRRALMRVESWS